MPDSTTEDPPLPPLTREERTALFTGFLQAALHTLKRSAYPEDRLGCELLVDDAVAIAEECVSSTMLYRTDS